MGGEVAAKSALKIEMKKEKASSQVEEERR